METEKDTNFQSEMPVGTSKKNTAKESIWDLLRFILIAIAIVLPIRILVAQPFIVSGSSMFPTFKDNQYLIVDQISYRFENPERGDVVIFRFPLDESKFFIKRIIGLPNETVTIENGVVIITDINGQMTQLNEPYLELDKESHDNFSATLKNDEYFVMGDNRIASSDSRSWGLLPRKNVVGKAFLRLLPATEAAINPGAYHY